MTEPTTEPTVVRTNRDVNVREVRGGFVVILVKRHDMSDGSVRGEQEDCVAGTAAEAAKIVGDFLA